MGTREDDFYRVEIKVERRTSETASYREGETLTEATFDAATLGGITDAVRLVAGAVECDLHSYAVTLPKRIEWTRGGEPVDVGPENVRIDPHVSEFTDPDDEETNDG